jgi:hypothetical protein
MHEQSKGGRGAGTTMPEEEFGSKLLKFVVTRATGVCPVKGSVWSKFTVVIRGPAGLAGATWPAKNPAKSGF